MPRILAPLRPVEGSALSNVEGSALSNVEGPAQPRRRRENGMSAGREAQSNRPAPVGGLWFGAQQAAGGKPRREPAAKSPTRIDPRLVSAARELRDRWLEQVNADPSTMIPRGKYAVCRALPDPRMAAPRLPPPPLLAA